MRITRICVALALACAALIVAGCFEIEQPDLFLLTRTGAGQKLTMLVNSDGSIRCNRGKPGMLSSALIVQARNLATNLNTDAQRKLNIPRSADSVYMYTVKVQEGTISFPDTAAKTHSDLAQLELFTLQAAQQSCGGT